MGQRQLHWYLFPMYAYAGRRNPAQLAVFLEHNI